MRASSELHLRSVWSFPFDFQSTPPHEDALVYGLSLLMLLSRGTLTPRFIAMPGATPSTCSHMAKEPLSTKGVASSGVLACGMELLGARHVLRARGGGLPHC